MNEDQPGSAFRRSVLNTMPIVLAGSLAAATLGMTGPVFSIDQAPQPVKKPLAAPKPVVVLPAQTDDADPATSGVVDTAAAHAAPASYTVVSGDTVAGIAGRFGLSTASVLALNGLSWKSTIFPGQTLSLSSTSSPAPVTAKPTSAPAAASTHTIARGDTLSSIAKKYGVSTSALLSANGLGLSSIIYPGQSLAIPRGGSAAATPTAMVQAPAAPSAATGGYTIRTGDTLASIAKATGTTVQSLLQANGLSWSSTIYAGKKLTIPGATAVASAAPAVVIETAAKTPFAPTTSLTDEQKHSARTIISVGRQIGASDQAIVIALAAAAQESSLRNIHYGDRDSVGLFQQRPSTGWGTVAQLTDPVHATKLFFGGKTNPNKGFTKGLLDVTNWSGMSVTQAAQAVQYSAYPTAYAKWEAPAREWLRTLG
ncbi:LysM peptidoglycan-binding domain-containing protein [Frigoribacterium sp. 2-23]|uniref:LysM peptidoglycan-binding domain-containing protein n=1 Tax=Frigoribacterium sp. 2-23 TaxID=3415006 RepID=UPI003C702B75